MSAADPFGLVGQVLDGQFRVDKLVGEGGFSAVYRGHHQGLNEPIAVKCLKLPASLGTTLVDTFVQRFRDESRILYRLSQGNLHVVRSIAAGTTQAPATGALVPYMVLEWLEGRSVQADFTVRRTQGEKGRTLEAVVKLFDTAADGLGYAHAQGVAHRDLNPGNLFLATTQHGVKMKVLDFGVAKLMHDGALDMGPRAATVGQIKIFAPAYGAPEQFDDRLGTVGVASDVYSFALILLEALRDRNVVEGAHLGEFAQLTCDPARRPTPRALGIDVPDEVEQAFARATTLAPAQRWPNVADFWKSLTIAMNHATERKYESAARETPPLAMGARGGAPAGGAGGAGGAGKTPLARTMPLSPGGGPGGGPGGPGAGVPAGFPRPAPGASRPRIPTTIGIPAPATGLRPAGAGGAGAPISSPKVPVGAGRTLASPGSTGSPNFAATLNTPGSPGSPASPGAPGSPAAPPPLAPPRATARPPSSPRNAMPNMPNLPPLQAPAGMAAPATARFPASEEQRPAAVDDDDEEDEATRVHAPAPEVLQTLALHQAVAAKNAAAMNRVAAARPAAGAPPPAPPPVVPPSPESSEEAAALAGAARDAAMKPPHGDMHGMHGTHGTQQSGGYSAPSTPVPPPSGATLMMSPEAHAAAQHAVAAAQAAAAAHAQAQGGAPLGSPLGGPPQPYGMSSTLAMMSPAASPDSPFGSSSGMQAEALFGSIGVPPVQAAEPLNVAGMQGVQRMSMSPAQGQQSYGQQQQQGMGMATPYGHGSQMVPQQPNAPHAPNAFGPPSYAQPGQQGQGQAAPKSAFPVLPVAIGLGVLAILGGGLGIFALRSRRPVAPDPSAMSASAASVAPTPVPVPVPVPVEGTGVPSASPIEIAPAATVPAPEPSASAAPADTATAEPTAATAAPTATTTAAVTATATATATGFTPPPTTATATPVTTAVPKPAADPNAFNEAAAKTRLAQANGVLVICQKGSGVSGPGTASVTFAPDGSVSAVSIDPPYAGTKEGDCAAGQFRRAKVSAFTGSPQTVRHSFEVPK